MRVLPPHLVGLQGVDKGRRLRLDVLGDVIILGRDDDADLRIRDRKVSRAHTRLEVRGGEWWVCDLGSANGTLVNRERVEGERLLAEGDLLRLGDSIYRFQYGGRAPDKAETAVAAGRPAGSAAPAGGGAAGGAGGQAAGPVLTGAAPSAVRRATGRRRRPGLLLVAAVFVGAAVAGFVLGHMFLPGLLGD